MSWCEVIEPKKLTIYLIQSCASSLYCGDERVSFDRRAEFVHCCNRRLVIEQRGCDSNEPPSDDWTPYLPPVWQPTLPLERWRWGGNAARRWTSREWTQPRRWTGQLRTSALGTVTHRLTCAWGVELRRSWSFSQSEQITHTMRI